ncbi:hypothetical protein OG921_24070 [Aldersonia sp. NBC_00410]|uniref:hypothetical protein n=1 Tax=Aldersonia sp. NBC_00410 TaxID=2975954 RepID=UPI00225AF72C|nr:hypothetical protein [Aldersonia sp. NBC_00410]MCX5046252.1 hypothetical protein [Aldersonia sp. NBC_00410]
MPSSVLVPNSVGAVAMSTGERGPQEVAGVSADRADVHAIVVTSRGSRTASGASLTGPVDSVEKLGQLLEWASRSGRLTRCPDGADPQLWIVGRKACALLGWEIAERPSAEQARREEVRAALTRAIGANAAPLMERGWAVRGNGHRVGLSQRGGMAVEVILQPYAWTDSGLPVPGVLGPELAEGDAGDDESVAAELGRRLSVWFGQFATLPRTDPVTTGSAIVDRIRARRDKRGKGLVVTGSGALPAGVGPLSERVQPRWTRLPVDDFREDVDLVVLEQVAGLIASAGMVNLGHGATQHLNSVAARDAVARGKLPFALWHVVLPAAAGLVDELPEFLPLPDPRMRYDEPVRAWLTTVELEGLCATVRDGGAGLAVADLDVGEAWVWARQGRALEPFARALREAREAREALGDMPFVQLVDRCAASYLTSLADAARWESPEQVHHLQPAWQATICGHARFRGRTAAMRISREYRVWPLQVSDTAMVYAVEPGLDLSDGSSRLGRMAVNGRVELDVFTDEDLVRLVQPESIDDVAAALDSAGLVTTAQGISSIVDVEASATPDAEETALPADTRRGENRDSKGPAGEPVDEDVAAAASGGKNDQDRAGDDPAVRDDLVDGDEVDTEIAAPTRVATREQPFTGPAVVLDVDGAFLGDGTRRPLPQKCRHVGELVEFASELGLGTRLSKTFSEPGQIWITDALAQRFGITDITAMSRRGRNDELRKLTATLPFVTDAVAAGWSMSGRSGEPAGLGGWTRVWREGVTGMWVVLMSGLSTRRDDMPILSDEPGAAVTARRLGLIASTLGYPWKVSAPMTAIDMMRESRSQTWSPEQWNGDVMAGSTFKAPGRIIAADIEWSREPSKVEAGLRYLHCYDRGGSHTGPIAGLELPIGLPTHYGPGEWEFDDRCPAYILTTIGDPLDLRFPHPLNPVAGRRFDGPQWVTTPMFARAVELDYQLEIHEAYVWHTHGRVLRGWYEPFARATVDLDKPDPDLQAVRDQLKLIRTAGVGMLASKSLIDKDNNPLPGYSPERRFHIIAKAVANIVYRVHEVGKLTGRWPLAITRDSVCYASDDPDPVTAWPMHDIEAADPKRRTTFGRAFGQYKPERSGLLADQLPYLNGRPYKGKHLLTKYTDWVAGEHAAAGEGSADE